MNLEGVNIHAKFQQSDMWGDEEVWQVSKVEV